MFLKLVKEDFSWPRARKALPVFLLLWLGGLLLAGLYLISIRTHLQAIERGETGRLLDGYLAAHRSPLRHSDSLFLQHENLNSRMRTRIPAFVSFQSGSRQRIYLVSIGLYKIKRQFHLEFRPPRSALKIIMGARSENIIQEFLQLREFPA